MAVILDPDLERELERRANERGYRDVNEYLRAVLRKPADQAAAAPPRSRGQRFVDHLRGKATKGLSTDEIMTLTRGDDA